MRYIATILLSTLIYGFAIAQTGEITGRVTDDNGEGIPFANVAVVEDGVPTGVGTTTDFDGNYSLKPLVPAKYDIKFSYVGYKGVIQSEVLVSTDKTTYVDVSMSTTEQVIEEVEIIQYKIPLIDPGQTSTQKTVTQEQIDVLPTKNVNSIASSTAGVFQEDEGDGLNVKGGREEATIFYIDGIKVRGSKAIPASSIEQMTVVTGGVPARYGDATGGIVNITTRGAAKSLSGGLELVTSEFLDKYGHNLVNATLTGPLIKKKDSKKTLMGFFLSTEYVRNKDGDPAAKGVPLVNDAKLAELEQNPLTLITTPVGESFVLSSELVTGDDVERSDFKPNVVSNSLRALARLDFRLTDNINLSFGTNLVYSKYHRWIEGYTLLNSQNNPLNIDQTYRAFARFTHNIGQKVYSEEDAEESSSAFQNAYYTIQVDYEKRKEHEADDDHDDNVFNYGYIGKFETLRAPVYTFGSQEIDGRTFTGTQLLGYADTAVLFTPSAINPLGTRFTEQYYELIDPNQEGVEGFTTNVFEILGNRALINGFRPALPHSIWYNTGRQFSGFNFDDDDQFRLKVNGAFDILKPGSSTRNKHAIEFGFEFEQRVDRRYSISAIDLWTLAWLRTSLHLITLDSIPILLIDGVEYAYDDPTRPDFGLDDTMLYNQFYNPELQTNFDRNLRTKLGLPLDGTDFIDIHSLDPSFLSLDMFSADEILNDGSSFAFWSGYDYLGNKLKSQPAFNDFFTKKDENDNFVRDIPAFSPIYTGAYIQDKFHFKDLTFNIGLRVDRFDANQKVLRDPYSLYEIRTVAEVSEIDGNAVSHPQTIGDGYAVYVDDLTSPNRILGYRDGNQWFDAEGNAIASGQIIAESSVSGTIQPYLVREEDNIKTPEDGWDPNTTFKDYEPQITVMPRLQFSFNLTDRALFFAHYDILTQRPTQSRLYASPDEWLFFVDNIGRVYPNPSLEAQKTIDFQLGFKQKVSNTSAVTISAYFREFKDMVQITRLNQTYPRDNYLTYGNVDFATTKGFSIDYDMRRTRNLALNANYTMEFAQGTGSSTTSQLGILQSNQPNLRTIAPLDFDARHTIKLSMDYRYGFGKDYEGPVIKDRQILSNAGINLSLLARSGTPYTQQRNATPEGLRGVAGRPITEGSLNGSRLPWTFRVDTKINKSFRVNAGGKDGGDKRPLDFNVYLQIQNLLNTQNITSVYRFTGNPDDDGYLESPEGQQDISNRSATTELAGQSFVDMYDYWQDRPGHYTRPRTIRLGAEINF